MIDAPDQRAADPERGGEALRCSIRLAARGVGWVLVQYAVTAFMFVVAAVMVLFAIQGVLLLGVAAAEDHHEEQLVGLLFMVGGSWGALATRWVRRRLVERGWALTWRKRTRKKYGCET